MAFQLITTCLDPEELEELALFVGQLEKGKSVFHFQTSGSTGKPKTYLFHQWQLKMSAEQSIDFFQIDEKDILLCPFSIKYVAAKMMIARAFYASCILVFVGPSLQPLKGDFPLPTFAAFVPAQIESILDRAEGRIQKIKKILIGGATLSERLERRIKENIKSSVFQSYGMTETLSHVAVRKIKPEISTSEARYEVLKGIQIRQNTKKCLEIKAPFLTQWLSTNDLVEVLNAREFRWLGREDLVINTGGIKVSIEEVESRLQVELKTDNVYVSSFPSEKWGEEVVLIVEKKNEIPLLLKDDLKLILPKHHLPKKQIQIEKAPRLANGKLDRLSLKLLVVKLINDGHFEDIV